MDHHTQTIVQCRAPADQGGAPATPDRPSPEPARATAALSVGRSGAPKAVAGVLDARRLGPPLAPGQAKQKRGAAEPRVQPPPGVRCGDAHSRAARGIAAWGAPLTRAPRARDGTPGGGPGPVGAWRSTLGEAAWRDVVAASEGGRGRWREALAPQPGRARPLAEERA